MASGKAPVTLLHAGPPSPLLCPVRKRETSQADIQYRTDVTALVEKVKMAVQCSHLWVLPPGTPGVWVEGRGPPPQPKACRG